MTAITPNSCSESDQKAIREQLVRILNSGPFHQAQRRQRFLEYIVNEALAGRGERLKGYTIAQAVFDRTDTFDSNVDPIGKRTWRGLVSMSANDPKRTFPWFVLRASYVGGVYQMGDV